VLGGLPAAAHAELETPPGQLVEHLGRPPFPIAQTFAGAVEMGLAFAGSSASVRDFVARARDEAGANYLALELAFGDISEREAAQTAELFAREVMPAFKD
jgi:hypothetical protein